MKRIVFLIFSAILFVSGFFELCHAQIIESEQKLTAGDGAGLDKFGQSVAISGDYAIVGAYGDDDNGESCGSALTAQWALNTVRYFHGSSPPSLWIRAV